MLDSASRFPSSAPLPFLGGGFPYYDRLQKKGTLILTSLLQDLGLLRANDDCVDWHACCWRMPLLQASLNWGFGWVVWGFMGVRTSTIRGDHIC